MDKEKIKRNLIELRGKRTQKNVSDGIGISQSAYAMYETGQRIPSDENKKKIADYYETTVQAIFFS